jgi:5'-nucleotidase
LQGIPSFALSQFLGPKNFHAEDPFEAAGAYGAEVVRKVLDANPSNDHAYGLFYNINFPPILAADVKGTRVVAQGLRHGTRFSVEPHNAPSGRRFLWAKGGDQTVMTGEGTDAAANLDGFISVTPMRADLTAHDTLAALKGIE